MSTDLTLFGKEYKGGLPAHLQNLELDETTKALMGGSGGVGKRISIKGGVYRMMVNGKEIEKNEDRKMNVVIVAAHPHTSRAYYEGVFKEGEAKAPDCWSDDGITPSIEAKNRQSDKCITCPQNIKGSGQGESKACRFAQRTAVVLDGDMDGSVYQMVFPAQSIFGKAEDGKMPLQAYAKFLGQHGLPITAVVTELSFDTNSATPKLFFRAIRPLTVEEMEIVKEQGKSDDAIDAINNNPSTLDGVENKTVDGEFESKPKKQEVKDEPKPEPEPIKKTQKKAQPVVEETEEDEEAVEAKKSKVGSILDEWDD